MMRWNFTPSSAHFLTTQGSNEATLICYIQSMLFTWHFTNHAGFVSLTLIIWLYLLGVGRDADHRDTIVNKQKGIAMDLVSLMVRANNGNAVPFWTAGKEDRRHQEPGPFWRREQGALKQARESQCRWSLVSKRGSPKGGSSGQSRMKWALETVMTLSWNVYWMNKKPSQPERTLWLLCVMWSVWL